MKNGRHPISKSDEFEQWLKFKALLVQMWKTLACHGLIKPPITDKNFPYFVELTPERRCSIAAFVSKQIEIYNGADELGVELSDTVELLRVALKIMGLTVDPKLYPLIKKTDVVELYGTEHLQLFRSFNFFEICNYNLDDILMYEWFHLYERSQADTAQIFDSVVAHLSSNDSITPFRVRRHKMKERFSDTKGLFEIELKYLASAFIGPGARDGYIATQEVKVLDSVRPDSGPPVGFGSGLRGVPNHDRID